MCECEKRINNLKETMNQILWDLHDLISSTTDESPEFYGEMWNGFEGFQALLEAD